jgi:hypothetical protein
MSVDLRLHRHLCLHGHLHLLILNKLLMIISWQQTHSSNCSLTCSLAHSIVIHVESDSRDQTCIRFVAPVFAILVVIIAHKEEVSFELLFLSLVQLAVFDAHIVALILIFIVIAAVFLAGGSNFSGVSSRGFLCSFGIALILRSFKV